MCRSIIPKLTQIGRKNTVSSNLNSLTPQSHVWLPQSPPIFTKLKFSLNTFQRHLLYPIYLRPYLNHVFHCTVSRNSYLLKGRHDVGSLPHNSQMGCKVRTVQAEIKNLRPSIKYDSHGVFTELKLNRNFREEFLYGIS
jgi:hypothetical protein